MLGGSAGLLPILYTHALVLGGRLRPIAACGFGPRAPAERNCLSAVETAHRREEEAAPAGASPGLLLLLVVLLGFLLWRTAGAPPGRFLITTVWPAKPSHHRCWCSGPSGLQKRPGQVRAGRVVVGSFLRRLLPPFPGMWQRSGYGRGKTGHRIRSRGASSRRILQELRMASQGPGVSDPALLCLEPSSAPLRAQRGQERENQRSHLSLVGVALTAEEQQRGR